MGLSMIPFNLAFGDQVFSNHFEEFVGVGIDFERIGLVSGFLASLSACSLPKIWQ